MDEKERFDSFGASAAICLINPSFHRVYQAGASGFLELWSDSLLTFDQVSIFGDQSRRLYFEKFYAPESNVLRLYQAYYFLTVGIGLGSFYLNRNRFRLGRFLVFLAAAIGWAILTRKLAGMFAVVFASTLALNGQEWFLDRFGSTGRTSKGWTLWSVGGPR